MPAPKKDYEALTHLSVHRDREAGEAPGMAGADLVYRGDKVSLDEERAERLLKLGAIRPWSERGDQKPPLTARDMSGKAFPDQPSSQESPSTGGPATEVSQQPESNEPKPSEQDPFKKQ